MNYRLELTRAALTGLTQLAPGVRQRMADRLGRLRTEPRPPGSRSLTGQLTGFRRLRVGPYRAIYHVDDGERSVTVVRVGHRRRVYQ